MTRDAELELPSGSFSGLYTPSRKSSTGSIKSVVERNDSWGTCTEDFRADAPRSDAAPRHLERALRLPRHDPDEFFRFSRTKLSAGRLCFRAAPAPPSLPRFNLGMSRVDTRVDASNRPGGCLSNSDSVASIAAGSAPGGSRAAPSFAEPSLLWPLLSPPNAGLSDSEESFNAGAGCGATCRSTNREGALARDRLLKPGIPIVVGIRLDLSSTARALLSIVFADGVGAKETAARIARSRPLFSPERSTGG